MGATVDKALLEQRSGRAPLSPFVLPISTSALVDQAPMFSRFSLDGVAGCLLGPFSRIHVYAVKAHTEAP